MSEKENKEEKEPKKERKLVKKKVYTFTLEEYDDGKNTVIRRNDGFNAFELLGIVTTAREELLLQFQGALAPVEIKREVIVDK